MGILSGRKRFAALGSILSISFSLALSLFLPIQGQSEVAKFRNFSPLPLSRPHQESILVDAKWHEFIRFLPNRGPGTKPYLAEVLAMLSHTKISKLKGFKSPAKTRITLSTLEVRSAEVLAAIEKLLVAGYHVRLVVDGGFAHSIDMPSDETWNSWTPIQKAYFVQAFDHDEDGQVTYADIARENGIRRLTVKSMGRVRELASAYPKTMELIESPREIVPERDEFNYPRLHHTKALTVQFREGAHWGGPVIDFKSSANLTDSCLSRRVASADNNQDAYLDGRDFEYHPKSQGHVQFGAVFGEKHQDREALREITKRLEDWYEAYTQGKPFDSLPPDLIRNPALLFEDGSTLEVYYSEGQRLDGKKTIDPVWAVTETLSRKDLQLTAYFDTQFVFTHTALAKHLRSVLSRNKPKELFIAVDSSQATEPWSALPHLLFAPVVREAPGVLPGKAIEETPPMDPALRWEENVFVYQGGLDWHGRDNDKLHLKLRYFEFVNADGQKVYVAMWGSANTSHNTSKLSADVTYIFKTKDPKLAEIMRPFFKALRSDDRMIPYSEAFLIRLFTDHFYAKAQLHTKKFRERVIKFLSGGKRRDSFDSIVRELRAAGPKTQQGELILRWLEWSVRHRQPLAEFGWDDLALIIKMTDPGRPLSVDFFSDLKQKWTESIEGKKQRDSARRAYDRLLRATTDTAIVSVNPAVASSLTMAKARLQENCESVLTLVRKGGRHVRNRLPVADRKRR